MVLCGILQTELNDFAGGLPKVRAISALLLTQRLTIMRINFYILCYLFSSRLF